MHTSFYERPKLCPFSFEKFSILNNSKVVRDIDTKFSTVVTSIRTHFVQYLKALNAQNLKFASKHPKLKMGMGGLFFEPHPPNLVRIHFFYSCNNAEILVMIS